MPKGIAITTIIGIGKEPIAAGAEFETTKELLDDLVERGGAKPLPKPAVKTALEPEKDAGSTGSEESEKETNITTKAASKAGAAKP